MTSKTTNIEAATPETEMGDASPQSKIAKYLEDTAKQINTRYGRYGLRSRSFAIDYNFAENGADGFIYQCDTLKGYQAGLDAGRRIRGSKVVINTEAMLMDGKKFGSVHLSRFQSGDPMALILSLVRGLAMGNVAANRGKIGHVKNAPPAIKSQASTGCEDYYRATGGIVVGKKWNKVSLVDISIEPGSWLDGRVAGLFSLIQEHGIVAPPDTVLLNGSKAGGSTRKSESESESESADTASSAVSLDFGTADDLASVRAYFGASTNSALSVILADLVKAQMSTGKVPLKIAN